MSLMLGIYLWNVIHKGFFLESSEINVRLYFLKYFMPVSKVLLCDGGFKMHTYFEINWFFTYLLTFRTKCHLWNRVNINDQLDLSTQKCDLENYQSIENGFPFFFNTTPN